MAGCGAVWLWSANFALLVITAYIVVSAQAASFVLKWSPEAHTHGLQAFEGVQDDIQKSDPGVKHIYVQGNTYRFDMPASHESGRKRVEVLGMAANQTGKGMRILKGESWRIRHKFFIPRSLQATTRIMQLVSTLPTVTLSSEPLASSSVSSTEALELAAAAESSPALLAPLQEKWIESQITFTAVADGAFQWLLRDAATNVVIVHGEGTGELIQADRVRPKWGLYRSVTNATHLHNCFMLIRDLQAWKQE